MEEVRRQQVRGQEDKHRLMRAMRTGAWLTVIPNRMNGTALSEEEFQDNLCLRYGMHPLHLQQRCDGCNAKFSVEHSLTCKKGGLLLLRHSSLNKEWGALGAKALSHSAVTYEPAIHSGRSAQRGEPTNGEGERETQPSEKHRTPPEERGDVAIHGFWKRGTTAIFDGRVTCLDAPSYWKRCLEVVLKEAEQAKKKKYLEACQECRQHFTLM
eukprot:393592-Ditylum_brightwellii.AAC.1